MSDLDPGRDEHLTDAGAAGGGPGGRGGGVDERGGRPGGRGGGMDERGSSPGERGGNPAERGSGVDERGSSPGGRGGGGGERGDRAGGRGGGGGGESGGGRGVVEGRRVKVGGGELRVTRWIGRGLYRTFARVTVTGEVPATGAVLLAVNHTALVDGPLLYGVLPRPVAFLTKAEVFWGPLGLLLRYTQQIAVHRGAAERAPLLAALGFLRAGGVVGVFPEGTRGDGNVAEVQHGIAYLAVRSGAPVVPVAVHGTAARRGREFFRPHRPPVLVAFGPPLRVPSGAASRRTVAAAAVEIHRTLAAHVSDTRPHPEEELS